MRPALLVCVLLILACSSSNAQVRVEAIALQPDGKIVAGGTVHIDGKDQFGIVRYLDNGNPDIRFGSQGIVTKVVGKECKLFALAIQSDGSIVAGGFANTGRSHAVAIARFTANGVLDTGFGTGGTVTTETGLNYARAFQLLIQPDKKLLAIGHSNTRPAGGFEFMTIRYDPNGSLDRTFGRAGIVRTSVGRQNNGGQSGALQNDGKILVVGHYALGRVSMAAVARYLPNGSPDLAFGKRGLTLIPIDGTATAATVLADGRVLVGGDGGDSTEGPQMFVAALNSKGTIDPQFGKNGILTLGKGSLQALRPHPDGSFLVTGWDMDMVETTATDEGSTTWTCSFTIKFHADGSPPIPSSKITSDEPLCGANDIVFQADGRLLVGTWGGSQIGSSFVVLRFDKDGKADPSFGKSGKAETVFEN